MEKFGPCQDKNCGHCCDPLKVDVKNQGEPPKDKNGRQIFIARNEILIPENHTERVKLKTYDCVNYDKTDKVCLDYENRPDMCRNSSCITDKDGGIDFQHKKTIEEKFVTIIPKLR